VETGVAYVTPGFADLLNGDKILGIMNVACTAIHTTQIHVEQMRTDSSLSNRAAYSFKEIVLGAPACRQPAK
jgi:hypothetical protein